MHSLTSAQANRATEKAESAAHEPEPLGKQLQSQTAPRGRKNDVQTLKESARKKKRAQARPPLRTNAYITGHCVSIHLLTYIHRHTQSRKAHFRIHKCNSATCCLNKTKLCGFFRGHIRHFLAFYFSLKPACNDSKGF